MFEFDIVTRYLMTGKRGRWYNTDYSLHFGAPVEEFNLEKLMEADTEDTDGIFRIMDEQFKDSVTQDINSYKKLSI